jgi:hypothetical protein
MRTLGEAKAWLKRLSRDLEKESVSQMKGVPSCCSKPIEPMTNSKENISVRP